MTEIPLTRGFVAVVDDEDAHLAAFKWCVRGRDRVYVSRDDRERGTLFLHREVLGAPPGVEVDHINGNPLDNRRANLRLATHGENSLNRGKHRDNRSGFKGVHFHPQTGKWRAQIMVGGRKRSLGLFSTPEDAARAYDSAALELHGTFAKVNGA